MRELGGSGKALHSLLRALPRLLPIRGWVLLTERIHPLVAQGRRELLTRTDEGVVMQLDLDDYVQRGIFYGTYERPELLILHRILRRGDVVIDVGAHVGLFALTAGRLVGSAGQVHAFEPVPFNYERLRRNIELNQPTNVFPDQLAVGAAKGTVSIGLHPSVPIDASSAWQAGFAVGMSEQAVRVEEISLDDYLTTRKIDRPVRLVKIDVEGYEPRVLAGMDHVLRRSGVDMLLIEINAYALARLGSTVRDVSAPLTGTGYRPFRIGAFGRLTPWTYRGEPDLEGRVQARGIVSTIRQSLRDRERNFNLLWIREGLSSHTSRPRRR